MYIQKHTKTERKHEILKQNILVMARVIKYLFSEYYKKSFEHCIQ